MLQTDGSPSMQSPGKILLPKEPLPGGHHALKEQRRSKELKLRLLQGEQDQGLPVSRNTGKWKVQRRSDHLSHSCSRPREGLRSDQQMQAVSPAPLLMGLQWVLMRRDWRQSGTPQILHTTDQAGPEETAEGCITESPIVPCIGLLGLP